MNQNKSKVLPFDLTLGQTLVQFQFVQSNDQLRESKVYHVDLILSLCRETTANHLAGSFNNDSGM